MAGYNSVNLLEGRPNVKGGETLKFKISENDVTGFTLSWVGLTEGTVEHSFDGGITWVGVTGATVGGNSFFYAPAPGLLGPLGRVTFDADGSGSLWYARRT